MPIITIICPFTRGWAIERWVANLESLNLDWSTVNLCAIIDCDEPKISYHLRKLDDKLKFRSFQIAMNREHEVSEVRVNVRRHRIAEVMNQLKEMVKKTDGDIVVGFEDDTAFEGLEIENLYVPLVAKNDIGFVEGVQSGRWGVKMVGAWKVDDIREPTVAETLFQGSGYEEIDGGGLYGYACLVDLFLKHEFKWEGEPYGPDVNFGLFIRRQGYRCLVDWDTVFLHNDHNVLIRPDNPTKIRYTKVNDNWERSDHENTTSL